MGRIETVHLKTIIDFAWRCEICSVAPTIPEGVTTMPELWTHLAGEGWTREGHLYRCPGHPINNRVWCRAAIWWGGKSKWFHEDDGGEVIQSMKTWRIYRFQCSWATLQQYPMPMREWMDRSHVARIGSQKRLIRLEMESGNVVHLLRVSKRHGILWSWLGLEKR